MLDKGCFGSTAVVIMYAGGAMASDMDRRKLCECKVRAGIDHLVSLSKTAGLVSTRRTEVYPGKCMGKKSAVPRVYS